MYLSMYQQVKIKLIHTKCYSLMHKKDQLLIINTHQAHLYNK